MFFLTSVPVYQVVDRPSAGGRRLDEKQFPSDRSRCSSSQNLSLALEKPDSIIPESWVEFGLPGNKIPLQDAFVRKEPEIGLPSEPIPSGPLVLIAIVTSCCDERSIAKREVVRKTWLSDRPVDVSYRFFVAQPSSAESRTLAHERLAQEARRHDDLTVLAETEHYSNLSKKTIAILRYAVHSGARFLVKTDDDVYMRLPELMRLITRSTTNKTEHHSVRTEQNSKIFLGKKSLFRPIRIETSKYFLSYDELPDEDSPTGMPMVHGGFYIISAELVRAALERADMYNLRLNTAPEDRRSYPPWWGRIKGEDVIVSALVSAGLGRSVNPNDGLSSSPTPYIGLSKTPPDPVPGMWPSGHIQHVPGYAETYEGCFENLVAKHLHENALVLMPLLHDIYKKIDTERQYGHANIKGSVSLCG